MPNENYIVAGNAYVDRSPEPAIWTFQSDHVKIETRDGHLLLKLSDKEMRAVLSTYCKSNP